MAGVAAVMLHAVDARSPHMAVQGAGAPWHCQAAAHLGWRSRRWRRRKSA